MKTLLQIKKLNYKNILEDVNIDIYENTIHYISGSNNCGKTTLMKILSGETVVKDSVFYQEQDINNMSIYEFNKIIGIIIKPDINFNFTNARQEILYRLDKLNIDKTEEKKRYKEIMSLLDLQDIISSNISSLSEYQKLKLALAIELIKKPKVLILGDVFIYLSKQEQENIFALIKKIENTSVIIFNNDLNLSIFSDYLHLFNKGKLILSGKTLEVLEKDSIINKLGLDLPFMVDLSLKLKYYNLVNKVELDMNRMVKDLWK